MGALFSLERGVYMAVVKGNTGKTYETYGDGTIKVTYADGSSRTVSSNDSSYAVTKSAMDADTKGGSYMDSYNKAYGGGTTNKNSSNSGKTQAEINQAASGGGVVNTGNKVTNKPVVNTVNNSTPTAKPQQTVTQPVQTQPVQQWDTSGKDWTNMSGANGLNYAISGLNGTIITTDANGQQTRYLPTDANFNNMYAELQQQTGNSYVPTYNWTTANGTDVTTKNYLLGNTDLKYALEQMMKENGTNEYDIEGYAKSLYNRIGTPKADGTGIVTLADVNNELGRLGLSDYNSDNAVYTVSGELLPGNQFLTFSKGPVSGSGDGIDFSNGEFATYGGQQYLIGGDAANFLNYVNGKTGKTDNLSMIFGNMANNPYAQGDAEFMVQYNNALNQFNNTAGIQTPIQTPTTGTGSLADALAGAVNTGGYTGNQKVDQAIDYMNSLNNYNQATGGTVGTTNLLDMLKGYLDSGLEANQEFLAQQRAYAEQQAHQQASDAFVNKVLAGDAMEQQLSALGLGTSGALQSALMGVQGDYGNNLSEIQSNLYAMLNGLSEQELQQLTDYYDNMTKYAYQVSNDEADRAYKNAQLALQQQQARYDEAYRQQQLAMQQAQYEYNKALQEQQWAFEQRQYEDELAQQKFNNNITLEELLLKQQAAKTVSGSGGSGTGGGIYGGNSGDMLGGTGIDSTPNSGEVTTPQVDPATVANWTGSMDNLLNVDLQTALNLIGTMGQASQVQAPQEMDANQLAQLGLSAYNNAMANAPVSNGVDIAALLAAIEEQQAKGMAFANANGLY